MSEIIEINDVKKVYRMGDVQVAALNSISFDFE